MKNEIIVLVLYTKTSKDDYRPVSILPNISKNYERLMIKQISKNFGPIIKVLMWFQRKI